MAKILYSPGYGAGWSSWFSGSREAEKHILTYQPIVDAIEYDQRELIPDLCERLKKELYSFYGEAYFYAGGSDDLQVAEVNGPFRIDEYDGSESVVRGYNEFIEL